MTQTSYRKVLSTARRDLEKMYRQREDLERRIARMRQTIISLGALTKESREREYQKRIIETKERLTDAVLSLVLASDVPIHPVEIRQTLEETGFDIGSTNAQASVWSVLKRLEERPGYRPENKMIRMYEFPGKGKGARRRIGYWWGDQKPPKPWKPCTWWEERKKEQQAKKKAKSSETNE